MGEFIKDSLPDSVSYFESENLTLKGKGKWRTTSCTFHGGSDSMRINLETGAWVCMSCGVKGGDVLGYHMQAHGLEFIDAAKALDCWVDDGRPNVARKPTPLTPRQALAVMAFESTLAAMAAGNVAHGVTLTDADRARLMLAANRINRLAEAFA